MSFSILSLFCKGRKPPRGCRHFLPNEGKKRNAAAELDGSAAALRMVFLTHAQSGLAEISRKTAVGRYRLAQSAFFAVSTSALKASASLMASSDRLLRFISTFAFFRPFMKRE